MDVERAFALQADYKWTAKNSSVSERKEHLRRLRSELQARAADLEAAVIADLPQPPSPSSGGVTVNGWGSHFSEPKVGFGGVNSSGSGRSHGVWGFREFSNPKAIVKHR